MSYESQGLNMTHQAEQPQNNLSKPVYSKVDPTPDLLRNLTPGSNVYFEKNYEKEFLGDKSKPQNIVKPDFPLVSVEDTVETKYTRKRKIKRALCFAAWIFFCPCMLLGLTRRESVDPDDKEDMRDDPCMPCYYDPSYNPREPKH